MGRRRKLIALVLCLLGIDSLPCSQNQSMNRWGRRCVLVGSFCIASAELLREVSRGAGSLLRRYLEFSALCSSGSIGGK